MNKFIIIYGSFADGPQGYIGPFDDEDIAEEFWNKSDKKSTGWDYIIDELYPPEDPRCDFDKFLDDCPYKGIKI
jgi:hypothetical protein